MPVRCFSSLIVCHAAISGARSGMIETRLPNLCTDALELIAQRLSLRELARIAHTCQVFNNVLKKRLEDEHKRLRRSVLDGHFFLWPAQASILLRSCRRIACGLHIASGETLSTGDHMWVGVIKRDGNLHVRTTYSELRELPRDEDDAYIEASFTSKTGPLGTRFLTKGYLEVQYPFKHRAPGPASHAFIATFKAFWHKGPMPIRVRLFAPPEHDWLRGMLLMLLNGEQVCKVKHNEPRSIQSSSLALSVRLPSRELLEKLEPWDSLHATGATFSNKQFQP